MKNITVPFVLKTQKGKLTRLIYNENEYTNVITEFKKEIREIYNSIKNMEVSFEDIFSQILNNNVNENHHLMTINGTLTIKFINVNKIIEFQSIESTAKVLA